eukprot:9928283-Lingulodinium_polyedra.AAC.1
MAPAACPRAGPRSARRCRWGSFGRRARSGAGTFDTSGIARGAGAHGRTACEVGSPPGRCGRPGIWAGPAR